MSNLDQDRLGLFVLSGHDWVLGFFIRRDTLTVDRLGRKDKDKSFTVTKNDTYRGLAAALMEFVSRSTHSSVSSTRKPY